MEFEIPNLLGKCSDNYSIRQLTLMQKLISTYDLNSKAILPLMQLTADLEGLMANLEMIDPIWKENFSNCWWILESTIALCFDDDRNDFTDEDQAYIRQSLIDMKKLIQAILPSLDA